MNPDLVFLGVADGTRTRDTQGHEFVPFAAHAAAQFPLLLQLDGLFAGGSFTMNYDALRPITRNISVG